MADYVLAHGLAGLATRPLATAVGVSHGTLLRHFGSKENLVTEVIDQLRQRLADAAGVVDSLTLMKRLVTADGCPEEQAPLVASMIVAQARGLQLDLLTTNDRERVDDTFTLFINVIDRLRRTWPTE